jgi:hypothetical protein
MTSRKLIEKKAISLATTLELDLARVERETLGRLNYRPSVSRPVEGRLLRRDTVCVNRRHRRSRPVSGRVRSLRQPSKDGEELS